MIKQQIFALFDCLGAGFCGLVLGLVLGFYDFAGNVYYDLRGGLVMGGILFIAFFAACLVQCVNDFMQNQKMCNNNINNNNNNNNTTTK